MPATAFDGSVGDSAIILDESGAFQGYINATESAFRTKLQDLSQKCMIQICRHLDVIELIAMCAASPSFIASAVYCFHRYHSDQLKFNDLYAADQSKCQSFVMQLKYFGQSARAIIIENANAAESLNGLLLLKVMSKYCSENLESVTLHGLHIDFKCSPRTKIHVLSLLIGVSEWKIHQSTLTNCGMLFELCASSIERLTLHDTLVDMDTKNGIVQHYPRLNELSLSNGKGQIGRHMHAASLRTMLTLNANVRAVHIAHPKINGKPFVNLFHLSRHAAKTLSLVIWPHDWHLKLDRMVNLRLLALTFKGKHDAAKLFIDLAKDLEALPALSRLNLYGNWSDGHSILDIISLCKHVQVVNSKIADLSAVMRALVGQAGSNCVRIDLNGCRKFVEEHFNDLLLTDETRLKIVAELFVGANSGKTFRLIRDFE